MTFRSGALIGILALALGGCAVAPQNPVEMSPQAVASKTARIGVAMAPLPKVDTHLPGAGCLLCIAAANVANSELIDHSRTLPPEDLAQLKHEIARRIRAKGGQAIVVDEPLETDKLPDFSGEGPNLARKSFAPLKARYGIDKLVVIELHALGMWRTYSSYFPTSDPKATLQGRGYMVNLSSNAYEWYQPVSILKAADKAWDEPPKFPGLTNAYYQALELGKDQLLKPFD